MAEETQKPKLGKPKSKKKYRGKNSAQTLKSTSFKKYFSVSLLSLTLFILFVGYLTWHVQRLNIVKTAVFNDHSLITFAEQDLHRATWVIIADTLQLSDSHSHYFEEETNKNAHISTLEEDMMVLARLKPFYVQISILDSNGKEIIRVNGNSGNPIMVHKENLQNQSNHDYFQNARLLEKGTYYISPLILNEEFGQVERPLKPVIHVASPIIDSVGARNGVVVISYDATTLLSDLRKRLSRTEGIFHIVRPNGTWIIAPEQKKLWADQLDHGETFDLEYDSVWPQILATQSGVAVSGNTAFSFSRINLGVPISFVSPQIVQQEGIAQGASNDLILISVVQTPALLTWILENGQAFRAGAASALLFVSFISLSVSYPLARWQQARQQEVAGRRKDRAYFQTVTDTMVDGLIVIDSNGVIQSINRTALGIFGYQEKELINKNVTMLMDKNAAAHHTKSLGKYLASGKSKIIGKPAREVMGRHKSGKPVDLEIAVAELRSDPQNLFIGSLRDITEKKKAEQQIKHMQKMEAIGNLTGGIAHDFNNLLTAIQGSVKILQSHMSDMDDEEAREFLDIAYQSAKRGGDLAHRLLAFSRNQSLRPEVTELNTLVKNIMPLLKRTIDESIEVDAHMSPKNVFVKVDPNELESALLNLAVNARDAMPDGGHLLFEISQTRVTKSVASQRNMKPGHYAIVAVSDTGYGMPPEVQEKVFEPFFTTKEIGKGTGLGLSMVYGFMKQSDGHVSVYSEPKRGTTIKLYLKTTQKQQKKRAKEKQPVDMDVKETGTILLVEDDEDVRKFIVLTLETKGYTVLAAVNGPSAVKIMDKASRIDLLLTDVVLPKGMDGPAIAILFRQKFPNAAVIFSSGYTGRALKAKDFLEEGEELLAKPYDPEVLLGRVHDKMKTKKAIGSKKGKTTS